MSIRAVERLVFVLGFGGLVVSFVAQWLIFEPGNFSDSAGPVYIPVGEHGIYTSQSLGIAWYGGIALFLTLDVGTLIWRAIKRRKRR